MINSRKKGFTLVELVIVIAVIAILAAVLIPTFSSLVKKANLSADEQAVRQINTLLATEFVTEKPESLKDVVDMLDENGYNVDALIPLSKGYAFVWDKESNTISLVLIEKIEAGAEKLEEGTSYINVEVSTADKLLKALKAGSDITLEKDIIIPDDVVTLKGDVTIDLNGHNLDSSASTSRPFTLSNGSKLTIDAEGSTINCGLYGLINISEGSDATIIINGGTFNANTKDGSFIKIRNNSNVNITLNDVTYIDTASRSVDDLAHVLDASLNKGKSSLTINGGHFESYNGFCLANMEVTISGAKISAKKYGLEAGGNTKVTVENCIVQTTKEGYECAFYASNNGTLIISNSTFNGDCNYAYGVLTTGGTLTASNNKVNTANEYYVYQLQEGASAFVTINGEKK